MAWLEKAQACSRDYLRFLLGVTEVEPIAQTSFEELLLFEIEQPRERREKMRGLRLGSGPRA